MKSKFFCFLFFSGTVNTNPHIVCPLYSSAPCQAFHRDVLRHLWAGGPAPGRAGKGGSERGGPAPGGSVGEGQPGQHVSAQTSFLQARELSPLAVGFAGATILANVCNKTFCLWNEWSARKMSLRRFHCVSHSEASPGTSGVLS